MKLSEVKGRWSPSTPPTSSAVPAATQKNQHYEDDDEKCRRVPLIYDAVVFPLLLKRVYGDKDVQEWIVRSSGLDWTIVRPGLLTNRPATGRYRVLTASKDWQFGAISRSDVADFLVQQINDRTLVGTTPLLIS